MVEQAALERCLVNVRQPLLYPNRLPAAFGTTRVDRRLESLLSYGILSLRQGVDAGRLAAGPAC